MLNSVSSEKYVLSVDIGVKNLAYCLFKVNTTSWKVGRKQEAKSTYSIVDWNVVNLLGDECFGQPCEAIVQSGANKGKECGKPSKITVPRTQDDKAGSNGDATGETLCYFYCNRHNPDKEKYAPAKVKKVADVLLQDLCIKLMGRLNQIPILRNAHDVVIEQQIRKSPKNIQMGHLVFSYFVIHGVQNPESNVEKVRFVSARNKYKSYRGPKIECKLKNAKDQRKWLAIRYVDYMLAQNPERKEWLAFFQRFPEKKDDLSDCFLQGVWWIEQRYNKKKAIPYN